MPISQEELLKAAKRAKTARYFTKDEIRALHRMHVTATNIRRLARVIVAEIFYPQTLDCTGDTTNPPDMGPGSTNNPAGELEKSTINVTKPYKPRILKMDFKHVQQRRKMKLKRKTPQWKHRNKLSRQKYMRRWGSALKKRADRVRQLRKSRGLN